MPHDSLSFMMPGLNYQIVELNFQNRDEFDMSVCSS